jgi:hypothetical protein
MNEDPSTTRQAMHSYPSSWADRLTAWVEHLPLPTLAVYILAGLAALLLFALNDSLNDLGFWAALRPFHIVLAVEPIYAIALIWFLDQQAAHALERIRPLLSCNQADYELLRYRLTNTPARATLAASLAGLAVGLAAVTIERVATPRVFASLILPGTSRYFTEAWLLGTWFVFGALFYHTYHQLRTISHIYTEHARIDLDQSRPLYNLSQVSAWTAIGLLVLPYGWYAAVAGLIQDPVGIGFGALFPIFAAVAFISPLVGVHRLLVDAKEQALAENALALKTARTELYQLVESHDLVGTSELNDTLAALRGEQEALEHVPTWPWQPDTPRTVIAAILLPLVLWSIQWLLGRLLER